MTILEDAERVVDQLAMVQRDIDYKQKKVKEFESDIEILSAKKLRIGAAKEFNKKAIDILYESSIKELEELIDEVINTIFYDRELKIIMELTDSRSKSLVWRIYDLRKDVELSVKTGTGRGIRTVLSFIIQAYYVMSLGSKFLFIDEGYSFISEAYIGRFFEYVRLLCKEKGLHLVMISHDERFAGYADKHYGVLAGRIYNSSDVNYEAFKQLVHEAQKETTTEEADED